MLTPSLWTLSNISWPWMQLPIRNMSLWKKYYCNKTYHSNHTLEHVYDKWYPPQHVDPLPLDVIQHLLALNAVADKKYVAMKKILLFHDEIDVKPLSEWGLKMLPCIVEWFGNAKALVVTEEVNLCIDSIDNLPYSESSCFILNSMSSCTNWAHLLFYPYLQSNNALAY